MNPQPKFAAVCFDCDSTLSRIEGIDELASRRGRKQEVSRLTEAAMNGSLAIDAVYAERLSIVCPDEAAMAWLGERYVQELVPGARETVEALHSLGKVVYLISGGLLPAVQHLSRALAIPDAHVFAVAVHFDGAGAYQGFELILSARTRRWQGRCVQAPRSPPRRNRHGWRRNDRYCCARGRRIRHRLWRRRLSRTGGQGCRLLHRRP